VLRKHASPYEAGGSDGDDEERRTVRYDASRTDAMERPMRGGLSPRRQDSSSVPGVPDFSGQYRVDESWRTAGNAEEVISRVARSLGVPTPGPGQPLEIELGSRLAMRSLGFLTPPRKAPVRLMVDFVPRDQATQLMVRAVSNQGWYAMSASRFTTRMYDRAFGELLGRLRQAAPPA
jgi:hypothetical protein